MLKYSYLKLIQEWTSYDSICASGFKLYATNVQKNYIL